MKRYVFVIAAANLDSEEPNPGDIRFLHHVVDAENPDDAYLFGQRALANALQDATERWTAEGHTWIANDYVVEVGPSAGPTLAEIIRASDQTAAPQLRLTIDKEK